MGCRLCPTDPRPLLVQDRVKMVEEQQQSDAKEAITSYTKREQQMNSIQVWVQAVAAALDWRPAPLVQLITHMLMLRVWPFDQLQRGTNKHILPYMQHASCHPGMQQDVQARHACGCPALHLVTGTACVMASSTGAAHSSRPRPSAHRLAPVRLGSISCCPCIVKDRLKAVESSMGQHVKMSESLTTSTRQQDAKISNLQDLISTLQQKTQKQVNALELKAESIDDRMALALTPITER